MSTDTIARMVPTCVAIIAARRGSKRGHHYRSQPALATTKRVLKDRVRRILHDTEYSSACESQKYDSLVRFSEEAATARRLTSSGIGLRTFSTERRLLPTPEYDPHDPRFEGRRQHRSEYQLLLRNLQSPKRSADFRICVRTRSNLRAKNCACLARTIAYPFDLVRMRGLEPPLPCEN